MTPNLLHSGNIYAHIVAVRALRVVVILKTTGETTANRSFNGTGISVFHHYGTSEHSIESEPTMPLDESPDCTVATNMSRKTFPKLPLSYTQLPPVAHGKLSCAVPSLEKPLTTECPLVALSIKFEYRYSYKLNNMIFHLNHSLLCKWLQHVCIAAETGAGTSNVSWSAFHSCRDDYSSSDTPTATSSLLPLFQNDSATIAMVRHSLDVIKKLIDITNPGQSPVVAVDQPLFAIAKNV